MQVSGSILANLRAALRSVRRLKGGPVHRDTVDYWEKLVLLARSEEDAMRSYKTRELASDLDGEVSARRGPSIHE